MRKQLTVTVRISCNESSQFHIDTHLEPTTYPERPAYTSPRQSSIAFTWSRHVPDTTEKPDWVKVVGDQVEVAVAFHAAQYGSALRRGRRAYHR